MRESGVERADTAERDDADALTVLRNRYAAGELSDEAFARNLEALVVTESPSAVTGYVDQPTDDAVSERGLGRV